jgi:pyridoxamine 5'-phosphate oxidase
MIGAPAVASRCTRGVRRANGGWHNAAVTTHDASGPELSEPDVNPDPFRQFASWFAEAADSGVAQPDATALATATPDGRPSVRMVLLKGAHPPGFVFYTNRESRKGNELAANPWAALVIHWQPLHRQVRASGRVELVSDEASDAYFASRPRGAQIAAAASNQSRMIADREALMREYERLESELAGSDVPRPPHWGGYRLVPEEIEFWQGRPNRLHDRLRYVRGADRIWRIERLAP